MPTRRLRIELLDSDGNKYTVSLEGEVTREKALHLIDLVELLGGTALGSGASKGELLTGRGEGSKYDRVGMLVSKHYPLTWFSSREIQELYEREQRQPISLSTVATYLARMTQAGILLRSGKLNSLRYKMAPRMPVAMPKQSQDILQKSQISTEEQGR